MTATEAVTFPAPRSLSALDLTELDHLVAELTTQAHAYVSELHRTRRAAIRATVDDDTAWTGEAAHRRRLRVQVVAERLGISVTQVYQAMRLATPADLDAARPEEP